MAVKRRIVQKIDIYKSKNAPETGKGLLAYVHTIANNMHLPSAKIVRNDQGDLAVYPANTKGNDGTYRNNYSFANAVEAEDWKQDILDEFDLRNS